MLPTISPAWSTTLKNEPHSNQGPSPGSYLLPSPVCIPGWVRAALQRYWLVSGSDVARIARMQLVPRQQLWSGNCYRICVSQVLRIHFQDLTLCCCGGDVLERVARWWRSSWGWCVCLGENEKSVLVVFALLCQREHIDAWHSLWLSYSIHLHRIIGEDRFDYLR